MRRTLLRTGLGLVLCSWITAASADPIDGGFIARISDPLVSRCISAQDDAVTFKLVRAIERRQWNWLKSDKSIGLYIETTLSGSTGTDNKQVTFPRAFMIDVRDYSSGMVSLPVEKSLLSKFRLKNGDNLYANAEFSIKLVKTQGDEPAGIALKVLADSTKDLPIPANPFTTGFDFFVGVTNKFVDKYFNEKLSDQNSAPRAEFPIEFSADGDCSNGGETTGAIAIIFENSDPDALKIAQEKNYCLRYSTTPTNRIEYAVKENDVCPGSDASFKSVVNGYYLFVLNAVKSQVTAALPSSRYVFFNANANLPQTGAPSLKVIDPGSKQIAQTWADLAPSNKSVDKSLLADKITQYSTVLPTEYKQALDFDTIWPAGTGKNVFISDFSGASGISDKTTEIGKQSLSGIDAVSQDLAVSVQRCKYFGIAESDCF